MILLFLLCFSFCNSEFIRHGNVTYQNTVIYEVTNPKNLQFKLISETGDADLYIFNWTKFDKSNINFSEYQFKSDSFGIDTVIIDMDCIVPLIIVILGVAQEDSKFVFEVTREISKDLDYQTMDDYVQKAPGLSYEDLYIQHSFDSDLFYAQEEKDRLKLLSISTYVEEDNKQSSGEKKPFHKQDSNSKRGKMKESDDSEESSTLSNFLIALLEVIVNVIL